MPRLEGVDEGKYEGKFDALEPLENEDEVCKYILHILIHRLSNDLFFYFYTFILLQILMKKNI